MSQEVTIDFGFLLCFLGRESATCCVLSMKNGFIMPLTRLFDVFALLKGNGFCEGRA